MSLPKIIGFAGPAGVGKTTTRNALCNLLMCRHNAACIRLSFADPIKKIAMELKWSGVKDEGGRRLLQKIGETARQYNPQVFVELLAEEMAGRQGIVLIDDVRYQNEVDFIRCRGGVVIELRRRGLTSLPGECASHESEGGVDGDMMLDLEYEQVVVYSESDTSRICAGPLIGCCLDIISSKVKGEE